MLTFRIKVLLSGLESVAVKTQYQVLYCIIYCAKPPPGSVAQEKRKITQMQNLIYLQNYMKLINCD